MISNQELKEQSQEIQDNESSNKEYIEEWNLNTTAKYESSSNLTKHKRKRPTPTEQEKIEKISSLELTNAGDLTREEKLKCKISNN